MGIGRNLQESLRKTKILSVSNGTLQGWTALMERLRWKSGGYSSLSGIKSQSNSRVQI